LKVCFEAPSVFTCPPLGYGGIEQFLWEFSCALTKKLDLTLIVPRGSQCQPGGKLIVTIDPPGEVTGSEEEEAYKLYRDRLGEFDLIHSHSHHKWSYMYRLEHPEVKVVGTLHGLQTWRCLPPLRYPNLIALSQWHVRDMQRRYNYTPRKIPLGIDVSKYPFKEDKDDFYLCMGLMSPHKGHLYAVFLAEKMGFNVKVAGGTFGVDPSYVEFIKQRCRKPNVEFLGSISTEDKLRLMSEAKAVLLPFLIDEAFSILALECMATGTPVICFNKGALPELVKHGETGFLCDGLELGRFPMTKALKKLDGIDHKNCRRWVVENFDINVIASKHIEMYREVMEGKQW